jgi:hypothetical protein
MIKRRVQDIKAYGCSHVGFEIYAVMSRTIVGTKPSRNPRACFGEKGNLGTCSSGAALQGKPIQQNVHSIGTGPFRPTFCIAALGGRVGR